MNLDAQILMAVTTALMADGIPSIPVHDSVIGPAKFRGQIHAKMVDAWEQFSCKLDQRQAHSSVPCGAEHCLNCAKNSQIKRVPAWREGWDAWEAPPVKQQRRIFLLTRGHATSNNKTGIRPSIFPNR
jgi:hypothetical protein